MSRTVFMLAVVSIVGASAQAQSGATASTAQATTKRPRIGYAASPPPEKPSQTQTQTIPTIVFQNGSGTVAAPYVVLSDGSILTNFGNGYERALRPCAQPHHQTQVNQNGRDALGRILPPPGIAALQQGSRGTVVGPMPARNASACYRLDGQGRAEVVRN